MGSHPAALCCWTEMHSVERELFVFTALSLSYWYTSPFMFDTVFSHDCFQYCCFVPSDIYFTSVCRGRGISQLWLSLKFLCFLPVLKCIFLPFPNSSRRLRTEEVAARTDWYRPVRKIVLSAGGFFLCGLHGLPVFAWIFFRYSSFLPQAKDLQIGVRVDWRL